jgi:regulator of ribonuclease activity A
VTTLKTSDLSDACDEAVACALPLRGYGRRRVFAGTIRTIRCFEDIALMRAAVNMPGHDQVLVIDGGGSMARAIFGDVMADIAARNGWAGLVIHGAIRDCVEIDGMDIGVKALGTVPRRGGRTGSGEVDVAVEFGGIVFTPGRRLVADEDGVLVLPAGLHERDIVTADALAATAAYAANPAPST